MESLILANILILSAKLENLTIEKTTALAKLKESQLIYQAKFCNFHWKLSEINNLLHDLYIERRDKETA